MINSFKILGVAFCLSLLFACSSSSMNQKELTRIIVPRKTVQTKDTIFSRLGIELKKVDSIVASKPKREIIIKDLTGDDTLQTPIADAQPVAQVKPIEEPKANIQSKPDIKSEIKQEIKKEPIVEVKAEVIKPSSGNYHVVVASFPSESMAEAKQYVERLKRVATGAKLLVTESRVRVAHSSYPSMAIATAARDSLAKAQPKYKDCWVLKKTL